MTARVTGQSEPPGLSRRNRRRATLAAVPGKPAGPRVMVLGGGFLGAHITNRLLHDGCAVHVVTRSAPRPELSALLSGAAVAYADVSTMTPVTGLLSQIDHVVYALGSSSPVQSDVDPASELSAALPPIIRLLELLRLRPQVGLTYISSGGAIYGNAAHDPVDEDVVPNPISSYGLLKLTAERYLAMYASVHGIPVRILRVANAYGPGQRWELGQGIVARLVHCALTGEPFRVYGDGAAVRDYVHVHDIAAAVSALLDVPTAPSILNVGGGRGYSVNDVIGLVEAVSGRRIALDYLGSRAFDVNSIVLDVSRIREIIPYTPRDLPEGLQQTWPAMVAGSVLGMRRDEVMPRVGTAL